MTEMVNVAVDAMGGDNAPGEIIKGAVEAINQDKRVKVFLVGRDNVIREELKKYTYDAVQLEIVHTSEVIETAEPPVMAIRKKKDSSIVKAMYMVKEGTCDALVSAGSSGAILVGGQVIVGRIRGIERPPLAPLIPTLKGVSLLVDCGANVDARPSHLVQFARMGSIYMEGVMGIKNPRVAIVNIGAEEEKGNALVKDAFPMMAEAPYHFVGSVEARDLFSDIADVCVADGFAGNLVLKTMEGVAMFMLKTMKQELMADTRSKMGAALAKPALRRLKHTLDYTEVGGAPLLGVQGAVVKAHGSSNAHAFSCAIDQAIKMVNGHVVEIIEKGVAKMNSQDAQ